MRRLVRSRFYTELTLAGISWVTIETNEIYENIHAFDRRFLRIENLRSPRNYISGRQSQCSGFQHCLYHLSGSSSGRFFSVLSTVSIVPDHESRNGQSALNRAIVKSNVRRTATDRSPGDPRSQSDPAGLGERCNIGDASRASTTLRGDTEPTDRPRRRAASTNVRCCCPYWSILLLIGVRWSPDTNVISSS